MEPGFLRFLNKPSLLGAVLRFGNGAFSHRTAEPWNPPRKYRKYGWNPGMSWEEKRALIEAEKKLPRWQQVKNKRKRRAEDRKFKHRFKIAKAAQKRNRTA